MLLPCARPAFRGSASRSQPITTYSLFFQRCPAPSKIPPHRDPKALHHYCEGARCPMHDPHKPHVVQFHAECGCLFSVALARPNTRLVCPMASACTEGQDKPSPIGGRPGSKFWCHANCTYTPSKAMNNASARTSFPL